MSGRADEPEIEDLIERLRARGGELIEAMASSIETEIEFYRTGRLVPAEALRASCGANFEFMLESLIGDGSDPVSARETGRLRAEQGAPLADVMAAYRVGTRYLWDVVRAEAAAARITDQVLVLASSRLWQMQSSYTDAMTDAYRDVQSRRLLEQDQQRSALVEALLEGRMPGGGTVWEAAELLRLPYKGPFVVVAAAVPEVGRQALPAAEERLRSVGLASAWRLLPELQIGVVCVPPGRLAVLVDFLSKSATGRVGVSPPYDELDATGQAVRFARVALAGSTAASAVTLFEESPLTMAAVAAPDVMQYFVRNVLGGLDDLAPDDREVLLDTLAAWSTHNGSATETGEFLYCHPNTVRHRLHRIEERTGRSLNDPRSVAELLLALEAARTTS
ncbi:PucR family transcriptional regulator [Kribbella jiaozuonensis]|uniref:PucR family transcriptional regulator n=1 Tax=Kribbella jiaozuonensis TaxID=2575441 RepID=A0A4U3LMM0_9ACTN|nr:helix-turn-helix domain-containing protein [Kribbella jiaozuonensis]TKK76389.1 PucR family transcriptional regulator [Kribbella jiaozuonensis]